MKAIRDKALTPPGGWRYRQPESGALITAGDWGTLLDRVRDHRLANNYPIGINFALEVEDGLCRGLSNPDDACDDSEPPPVTKRKLTVIDLKNFLRVMERWASKGARFVPQEEAERRAAICAACPLNQHVEGCLGCKGITTILTKLLGARGTSYDAVLSGCQVCGCSLKAAVHIPLEAQLAGTRGMEFPEHCWKSTAQLLSDRGDKGPRRTVEDEHEDSGNSDYVPNDGHPKGDPEGTQ